MILTRNKALLATVTLVVVSAAKAIAQTVSTGDIRTTGSCSPVVIQPKEGFQIICHDTTLTRDQALKEAEQISEILSKLQADSKNSADVTKKLDRIYQEIIEMKNLALDADAKIARERAPVHTLKIVGGNAMPDLTVSLTQRVLLDADNIVIEQPKLPRLQPDQTLTWTLFIDQDGKGMHPYAMPFIRKNWPGLVGKSRASFEFVTEANGHTVMRSVPIVNTLDPDSNN